MIHLGTFVECPKCGDSGLEEYVNGIAHGTRTVAIIRCDTCNQHYEVDAILRLMGTEHPRDHRYRPTIKYA